jgi:hypothetical protein
LGPPIPDEFMAAYQYAGMCDHRLCLESAKRRFSLWE